MATSTAILPMTDKPPRPRRWVPLSLRMFVVILVLLGAAGALLTLISYRRVQQGYQREHVVTNEIKSWGGPRASQQI